MLVHIVKMKRKKNKNKMIYLGFWIKEIDSGDYSIVRSLYHIVYFVNKTVSIVYSIGSMFIFNYFLPSLILSCINSICLKRFCVGVNAILCFYFVFCQEDSVRCQRKINKHSFFGITREYADKNNRRICKL